MLSWFILFSIFVYDTTCILPNMDITTFTVPDLLTRSISPELLERPLRSNVNVSPAKVVPLIFKLFNRLNLIVVPLLSTIRYSSLAVSKVTVTFALSRMALDFANPRSALSILAAPLRATFGRHEIMFGTAMRAIIATIPITTIISTSVNPLLFFILLRPPDWVPFNLFKSAFTPFYSNFIPLFAFLRQMNILRIYPFEIKEPFKKRPLYDYCFDRNQLEHQNRKTKQFYRYY